jgi:hypothetical protein
LRFMAGGSMGTMMYCSLECDGLSKEEASPGFRWKGLGGSTWLASLSAVTTETALTWPESGLSFPEIGSAEAVTSTASLDKS